MEYDYLVVGAGLFGSVFAHEATKKGYACLVVDRRDHIGGNLHTPVEQGIMVHRYGPHIFHTDDRRIWDYVSDLVEMRPYVYSPIAKFGNERYSLPFNMNTFHQMWNIDTAEEAKKIIDGQREGIVEPRNLEEQAVSLVGRDVFEKLIKGYTEKQWGRRCTELPPDIIKRLPVRFTYDNNYFDDELQGIPEKGYTYLVSKLLEGSDVMLGTDFLDCREELSSKAERILYTGQLDRLYGYRFGELEYRSLDFVSRTYDARDYQGVAVINHTGNEVPYTRTIEHKHFLGTQSDSTIVTEEYPAEWNRNREPYYPINDETNNEKYSRYRALADTDPKLIVGGRLGLYRYLDMDDTIRLCLDLCEKEFGR